MIVPPSSCISPTTTIETVEMPIAIARRLFGMAIAVAVVLVPSSATRNSMLSNAAYVFDSSGSGVPQQRQRKGFTHIDINDINTDSEQRRPSSSSSSYHVERPLSPPFPNGPCDGTVINIPQQDLFPSQRRARSNSNNGILPFLNNNWDLSSSYENAILPPRDVKVWLPREYQSNENHSLRFPVLYCHDGQNGESISYCFRPWQGVFDIPSLYAQRK